MPCSRVSRWNVSGGSSPVISPGCVSWWGAASNGRKKCFFLISTKVPDALTLAWLSFWCLRLNATKYFFKRKQISKIIMGTNQSEGMPARGIWAESYVSPPTHLPDCQVLTALVGWNEMGGGIPGGEAETVQVARKVTPGTQVSGSYPTGMELFQYFNPQRGLTGIFRVIISSACHPSQNPKFHHVFPISLGCQHLLYGQQYGLTSSSGK